ncbi:MAG: isochorismatase family protein [Nanoarchaeota archaeon]
MTLEHLILANVDTLNDFMRMQGSLYVPGAKEIIPELKYLTDIGREYGIRTINLADSHNEDSVEISDTPDGIITHPRHAMVGTWGAEFIAETKPDKPYVLDWTSKFTDYASVIEDIRASREVVVKKDQTDSFGQRSYLPLVMEAVEPKTGVLYGVVSNICVDLVFDGFANNGMRLYVVTDAIMELPVDASLPREKRLATKGELYDKWESAGAKLIEASEVVKYLG